MPEQAGIGVPGPTAVVELTEQGYLHLPGAMAELYFPEGLLVPVARGRELWLYPTRGAAGGGLILKQRNLAGDRSVLIWEALPEGTPSGRLPVFWDPQQAALRMGLMPVETDPGACRAGVGASHHDPTTTPDGA
ncbi:MAG: hypothetical protein MI919_26685 [Holophagales bacterium]|nr:hypothetical protein [Holophagales bacterium]